MTKETVVATLVAVDWADDLAAKFNEGTGAGIIEFYPATVPKPNSPDDVPSGEPICTIILENPAFGPAADASPGGIITLLGVPLTGLSTADGTLLWARGRRGGPGTPLIDGTVGETQDFDFVIDSATVRNGEVVTLNSWTIRVPLKDETA